MKKAMTKAAHAANLQRPHFIANRARYIVPYGFWWHSALPASITDLMPLSEALRSFNVPRCCHHGCWNKALSDGRVQVRRQRTDADFFAVSNGVGPLVTRGDRLKVYVHVHEPPVIAELPKILLETERFVVVDKPAGLPTTGVVSGASLCVQGVLAKSGHPLLHPGHRLDRPVSGVLILARSTKQQNRVIQAAGSRSEASKAYVARVLPCSQPLRKQITSDAPLAVSRGRAVVCAVRGKQASTTVRPLSPPLADGTQLVECLPQQGRQHQIRAHLLHLGLPIANDPLYGGIADPPLGVATADEIPSYARALADAEEPWCPACTRARRDAEEEDGGSRASAQKLRAAAGIWLHALRYTIPSLGIEAEAPLPAWAAT